MGHQEQITFDTTGHRQLDDLTDKIEAIVERSGITTGIVHACCIGSTAAVGTIEFEPGLEDFAYGWTRKFRVKGFA